MTPQLRESDCRSLLVLVMVARAGSDEVIIMFHGYIRNL